MLVAANCLGGKYYGCRDTSGVQRGEQGEREKTRGWEDRGTKRDSVRIGNGFRRLFAEIREGK